MTQKKFVMSNRVGKMKYAIRDLLSVAVEQEKLGKNVIKLNIGDPLVYDYQTPEAMIEGMHRAAKEGKNYYSNSLGDAPVREAIRDREKRFNGIDLDIEDIMFTQGVSEAITFLFSSFTDRGDKVLLPGPTYPAYQSVGTVLEADIHYYGALEENNWMPTEEAIRKSITEDTKFISVINPNNPTGAVYSEKTLKMICDLAGEYNVPIVSDEIYDQLVFNDNFTSITKVSKELPVIVFNGFSKVYLAPGWRAGYAYRHDPLNLLEEPWEGMKKMARIRLCASTPIQYGAAAVLHSNLDYLPRLLNKLKTRRDLIVKRMNDIEGLSLVTPQAAFYAFPKIDLEKTSFKTDQEFVINLIKEKQVVVVNGSGFGSPYGDDHFRLVYLAQEPVLEEAMDRLEAFMKQHHKN